MKEEMSNMVVITVISSIQRLAGATLLVFANKQDLPGALSKEAIREVRFTPNRKCSYVAFVDSNKFDEIG